MAGEKRQRGKKKRSGPSFWESGRNWALCLAGILAVGWGLRALFLAADPPESISWSQGPFTDGAVVLHDARNKVLFGDWIVDYTKDLFLFPLSNIAAYPVFLAAGVGRWQAALPNTFFAVLSILAIGLGLASIWGRARSLLWVYLASTSYFLIMFQRIPLAEPAMVFLMSLSFAFFCLEGRWRWASVGCGFFAVAAPLFGKAHAYYFPAVVLATYWLTRKREEGAPRSMRMPLAGMGGAAILWLAVLAIPHADTIWSHVAHESYQKHVGGLFGFMKECVQNLVGMGTYTKIFQRMPVPCALGFFGFVGVIARGRRVLLEEKPAVLLAALWVAAGWVALALVRMPAPRYLSALVYPLLVLAVVFLDFLAAGRPLQWRLPRGRASLLLTAVLLFFAVYQPISSVGTPVLQLLKNSTWGIGIYHLFVQEEKFSELVFFCSVLSVIFVLLLFAALHARGPARPLRLSLAPSRGKALAILLLGLSLFQDGRNYTEWASRRTHYLRDASRDLVDWLGPGARLMGSYAPTLGLDNELPVFAYFGDIGDTDVFAKYGITHVVVVSQGDHAEVKEKYPDIFEKWDMVLSYPIRCRYSDTMGIFRLPGEAGGRVIHNYEPSLFERAVAVAKEQRWEESLGLLLEFTRQKPGNADGHYLVGFMYNELGRREEAAREIRKAIELRERPYYYYKLGEVCASLGQTGEAKKYLAIANRLNPRDKDVQDALESLSPHGH